MLLFISGPDTYRAKSTIKKMREQFLLKNKGTTVDLAELTASDFTLEKFNTLISQVGLLFTKKFIVLNNILATIKKDEEKTIFQNLLEKSLSSPNTILVAEDNPDKRTSLYKYLEKIQYAYPHDWLNAPALEKWINNYVKDQGQEIESSASQYLVKLCSQDLWRLTNELDVCLARSTANKIKLQDITARLPEAAADDIWQIIELAMNQQKAQALKKINGLLALEADPIKLLGGLAHQVRTLCKILALKHLPVQQIAQKTKQNSFVVQKIIQNPQISLSRVKKIYQHLLAADHKLKTTPLSAETILNLLIIKS